MQVSKWDDSLAVRLPAEVVESLDLKEGDEVVIEVSRKRADNSRSDISREEAIERLRAISVPLPSDFKFDREEANAR